MNNVGFCECGCGQKTALWRQSCSAKGAVKGRPRRFIQGHYQAVKKPPNYASCHPDRPVKAGGLCGSCYNKSLINRSDEIKEAFLARNRRRWKELFSGADKEKLAADRRDRVLKHRYGLSAAQHEAMVVAQDNRCAVCGAVGGSSRATRLYVDHNHTTGKVRSLLCPGCNTAIGVLEKGAGYLTSAVNYLLSHGADDSLSASLGVLLRGDR